MIASPVTRFELPEELSATEPPEARGLARDEVRLMVVEGERVTHAQFHDIARFLNAGDVLIVNTSATIPAAVDGTRGAEPVVVHFSNAMDDGTWVVELRTAPAAAKPVLHASEGDRVDLPGDASITLLSRAAQRGSRLWQARATVPVASLLSRFGRPIRYGYVRDSWPLTEYQTVFATEPGSAEMPSAARPFTATIVTELVSKGVQIAPITLHAGVSSLEGHEPPLRERFVVPASTARVVNCSRGRIIAVGTTAARAIESAASEDRTVEASRGWTELVLGPDRPARVVGGIVTGLHAPDASHLLMLEAIAGPPLIQRAYDAALERHYLWHEFGDVSLLVP